MFPGVESLKNFYEVLYGEGRLPSVIPTEKEPDFTEAVPGVPYEIVIHIADNPPLLAWTEYENLLMSGDLARVKYVLLEKQYLQKHFDYLENLKEYGTHPPMIRAITCWVKHEHGYFWEGGRSGMDNTPRGRIGEYAERE